MHLSGKHPALHGQRQGHMQTQGISFTSTAPAVKRLVLIASRNPAKISAATTAMQRCFPQVPLLFNGIETVSGVPDQPMGDEETLQGAVNRIHSIQDQQDWPADALFVAVEGGLLQRGSQDLHCFAWAAVKQASAGSISTARSAEFLLPRKLSQLVLQEGMELGAADDKLFGRTNSGQGSGTVGHLTNNIVTRSYYYEHAITMALIPFLNPDLYPGYCEAL